MNIVLKRDVFSDKFTLGYLSVNGKHLGFTCEDKDRHLEDDKNSDGNPVDAGEKVYGETAIPKGKYKVTVSFSHRFQKILPEILSVPAYSGVRIHGGNHADNSLGCVLLGTSRLVDGVANCAAVNKRLVELIQESEDHGEEVTLEII